MTPERRDELEDQYANESVDNMNKDDLIQIVYDSIIDSLHNESDVDFLQTVQQCHAYLLTKEELK